MNEDSLDAQISSALSRNQSLIHGSMESLSSRPGSKAHSNGSLDKASLSNSSISKHSSSQKSSSPSLTPKHFGSDNKMLLAVGLGSRPGTPKDKDIFNISNKSNNGSIKKSNNKKARHK